METKLFQQIQDEIPSRIKNRVGYVESSHPKEVLKGAEIATKIIEEILIQYQVIIKN